MMSPRIHNIYEFRFVAPDYIPPEGQPFMKCEVGGTWPPLRGSDLAPALILQEHLDVFADHMDATAKAWSQIAARGDHRYIEASTQTGVREPVHDLNGPCICAQRATQAAEKTRTAERSMLVRVTIYADPPGETEA
jgi:hypothetical protein